MLQTEAAPIAIQATVHTAVKPLTDVLAAGQCEAHGCTV